MTVVSCYLFGDEFTPLQGRDLLAAKHSKSASIRTLQILSSVCNGAKFTAPSQDEDPLAPRKIQGDATDTAILRFSDFLSSADAARNEFNTVYTQAFSSATKFMVSIVSPSLSAHKESNESMPCGKDEYIMMVKGAPDVLLRRCTSVYDPATDSSLPLDAENAAAIVEVQEKWASKGQRVLLVARRHLAKTADNADSPAFAEYVTRNTGGLEVVGLVGIIDPPREDIPETIRICRAAGIRVFMVSQTGEHHASQ
jgi:sodium/potassium-transporting ATPase subunit alpha